MQGRTRVLLLMLADALCLTAVWLFALWAYRVVGFGHYKFGLEFYLTLWPAIPAFVGINVLFRLYNGNALHPSLPVDPIEELRRLFGSSLITHLGIIAALALAYQSTEHYSRAVVVLSGLLTALLVQPVRNLVRRTMRRLDVGQIPVHVFGACDQASRLEQNLATDAYTGLRVVSADRPAETALAVERTNEEIRELSGRYVHLVVISADGRLPFFGAHAVSFDGVGAIELVNRRAMSFLRAEKRLLDGVLSVLAFVFLSPLFVLVPILIKLTSRGGVFYRHERVGKKGRLLRVWKFRTMYADADARLERLLASDPARRTEWETSFKLSNDPRVTPFGRFLRKTSLDELPQLFNVFAGDMALVGPRPIVEKEVVRYGDAYETFASVRPGITGLWQVSGRSDTDYPTRVALDVEYVLNWSPWMDLWVLMRTVGAVLFMRGAR